MLLLLATEFSTNPSITPQTSIMEKTSFFQALQSNAVLVDSDLVGSARLLWTIRSSETHLKSDSFILEYSLTGDPDKLYRRIKKKLVDDLEFCLPLENLYRHSSRGQLFHFHLDHWEKSYVPEIELELGWINKSQSFFSATVRYAILDEIHTPGAAVVREKVAQIRRAFSRLGLEKKPFTVTKISSSGNEIVTSRARLDDTKLAMNCFYPFIGDGLEEGEKLDLTHYIEDYMADSASVLICIGAPGTGKSTLARTIARWTEKNTLICSDEAAVNSGAVLNRVASEGVELLILEDIDRLLVDRQAGNGFMSTLLNEADGVCSSKVKIIINTNLTSLNKMDSGLVRHGRTYDVLHFRELEVSEARIVCENMGLDPAAVTEKMCLSDILAMKRPRYTRMLERRRAKFGF